MGKTTNQHGSYYSLPDSFAFDQDSKYHGCGNGHIIVDKATDEVVDMAYLDDDDKPMDDQNIAMHIDAGEVLAETDTQITFRANFSCWQACLF